MGLSGDEQQCVKTRPVCVCHGMYGDRLALAVSNWD